MKQFKIIACLFGFLCVVTFAVAQQKTIHIVANSATSSRVQFGIQQLKSALETKDYKVVVSNKISTTQQTILITQQQSNTVAHSSNIQKISKEGFVVQSINKYLITLKGSSASGILYGCLALKDSIVLNGKLPKTTIIDSPQMVMRGTCIGLQKTTYLPGRHVYEYPYTPTNFPWFYDKQLWIQYLDSLVENRYNALYLWNGHPFASLVKLKDYPYAVEVDDSTFKRNEEIFSFLTTEADKRGIWVIQMFYNIIVSKPFAEYHNIATQDRNRPIIPLIADYTRKSIAAFVAKYPNVGLMVALGEAMEGVGLDDIDWFTKTIIPGVKDGLVALGKTEEPPIVLRAHDTDAPAVMEAALPLYKNLYTEAKYNGEALTTYTPRGTWAELHRKLSSLGSVQIENVHILANLEPFRYGATDFIKKSVQAMHQVHQGNGLHLYPESSYWDWPYSADKTPKRLLQIERDWIWYKAWGRYAWNVNRNEKADATFWNQQIAAQYGTNVNAASNIVKAYNEIGEIAPKLLRRFGITDGNRQTLTLGMLMTQLINPYRYGLFTLLYNSEGPEGEMLTEFAEKKWKQQPHIGETPVQVINEVKKHAQIAVKAIQSASKKVTANKEEFKRIVNDVLAYEALANHFADKATAALFVLRYKYSQKLQDLDTAFLYLNQSVEHYKKLVQLTKDTYLYANSMQTQQRKIPVGGNDGKNKTWEELLPFYETELNNFKRNIDSLKHPIASAVTKKKQPLQNAVVELADKNIQWYSIATGNFLFADTATYIKDFAEELSNLNALKLPMFQQQKMGTNIEFTNNKPIKVLVAYFNSKDKRYLQPSQLETDASANDFGQAEPKINNAMVISGLPTVNVHTFSFKAGKNVLKLPKGICLVLGFVNDEDAFPRYDAGLIQGGIKKELDWLFE